MVFRLKKFIIYIIVGVIVFIAIFPIFWTFLGSFKHLRDIITPIPKFIFIPTLSNYKEVLTTDIIKSGLLNSAIIVTSSILLGIIIGVPAAYIIARYPLKRKADIQFFVLSLRFLPPVAIAIPFISLWLDLGLYDSYISLIITYLLISLSTIIWLSIPVFERVPTECEEAANLDGCSYIQVFFKISLPIATPTLIGGYIFTFILIWNELMIALSLTSIRQTLPAAASAFATMGKELPWGVVNASAILLLLPPLIFVGFLGKLLNSFFIPKKTL
jgi:multiple sugar transport system permease protein